MSQQGDVKLFQTNDDGDITVTGGVVEMSGGLETAAYLSLFGGNEDDDGRDDNPNNWWGNLDEDDPAAIYRSETQHLLQAIPATSGNLSRIEDAAKRDLSWMIDNRIASTITVSASIPALNRVKLSITIEANGKESSFEYVENWRASV
jgi:phage gp46-like protein